MSFRSRKKRNIRFAFFQNAICGQVKERVNSTLEVRYGKLDPYIQIKSMIHKTSSFSMRSLACSQRKQSITKIYFTSDNAILLKHYMLIEQNMPSMLFGVEVT
jgi:hypothetical protein